MFEVYIYDVVRMLRFKGKVDGILYEVKLVCLVVGLLEVL